MKKKILTMILCSLMVLCVTGCSNPVDEAKKDLKKAKQELEETYEKYGWVEKETVNTLIAKYNTEIMDGGLNTPAYDDYMVVDQEIYWFALTEDIKFYIKPIKCTNDKMKDIAELSAVRIDKKNYNEDIIINYAKKLIKANRDDLPDDEINNYIDEASKLKDKKQMSNNGKGISVGVFENDDFYEIQVKRLYK